MTSEQALENLIQQGLKVGSRVKVVKTDSPSDFHDEWVPEMTSWVGNEYEVTDIRLGKNKVELNSEYCFPATSLELVEDSIESRTDSDSYQVSAEFIKKAHYAAGSEWKKKIEQQFPDVFKPKVFKFGMEEHTLSTYSSGLPVGVANHIAEGKYRGEALLVRRDWKAVIIEEDGHQLIQFVEKK